MFSSEIGTRLLCSPPRFSPASSSPFFCFLFLYYTLSTEFLSRNGRCPCSRVPPSRIHTARLKNTRDEFNSTYIRQIIHHITFLHLEFTLRTSFLFRKLKKNFLYSWRRYFQNFKFFNHCLVFREKNVNRDLKLLLEEYFKR